MKKLILITAVAMLLTGCGKPISHRVMMELQQKYPDYELWEQPMVSSDYVFMRHKKDGSVIYTVVNVHEPKVYAVFGPLK